MIDLGIVFVVSLVGALIIGESMLEGKGRKVEVKPQTVRDLWAWTLNAKWTNWGK